MKRIKNFFNLILTAFTYPQKLAEAVNRAHNADELSLILNGDSDGICQ